MLCSAHYLDQSHEKGTDKARLLARMSKMGKNPLSLPGAAVAEPEEEDMGEPEQVAVINQLQNSQGCVIFLMYPDLRRDCQGTKNVFP